MPVSQNQDRRTSYTPDRVGHTLSCYSSMPFFGQINKFLLGKGVIKMRKSFVVLMTTGLVLTAGSVALADDITPTNYNLSQPNRISPGDNTTAKDWHELIQGTSTYFNPITGESTTLPEYAQANLNSTHPYGTWNSPYTYGIDGYNYNDAQDYTDTGQQVGTGDHVVYPVPTGFQAALYGLAGMYGSHAITSGSNLIGVETTLTANFTSGPHGGYLTSTHKCRECHAVHRAAGKFKLMRANTRFEACDWCHGTGAGSGFNIQMDSDDAYTTEYNTGHTMGFGIQSGKWKAPDDTYPAFTPNYWMGGFSCFDCHSPHANPQRIMGYDQAGKPIQSIIRLGTGQVFNMGNPGHDMYLTSNISGYPQNADQETTATYEEHAIGYDWVPNLGGPLPGVPKPYYLAGSWLLIKNPDRELATTTETALAADISYFKRGNAWPDDTSYTAYGGVSLTVPRDPAISGLYGSTTTDSNGMQVPYADLENGAGQPFETTTTVNPGQEIPDFVDSNLFEFSTSTAYPINKVPTDWNNPLGSASLWASTNMWGMVAASNYYGYNVRNPLCRSLIVDEFCTDCHDGNAGLHTTAAPLFSEDRALRNQQPQSGTDTVTWKGEYDIAYGHDVASRH